MCDCWRCRIDNIGPLAAASEPSADFRGWLDKITARGVGSALVPAERVEAGTARSTGEKGIQGDNHG